MKRIWIGKRESDIFYSLYFFDYSITYYGSQKQNNFAYCTNLFRGKTQYAHEFINFIYKQLVILINQHTTIQCYFYNSAIAYKLLKIDPQLEKYFCFLNEPLFLWLNNKAHSRLWLSHISNVPEFVLLTKPEITLTYLKKIFSGYSEFVIQKLTSSGGTGTYLLKDSLEESVLHDLNNYSLYLVSPYYKNSISINAHVLIDFKCCVVFPISEQIIDKHNNIFLYKGNNFGCELPYSRTAINNVCRNIGEILRQNGYRGICGIDLMLYNDVIYLTEINPRFQGSSIILDKFLNEKFSCSLYQLHDNAFNGSISDKIIKEIERSEINSTCFFIEQIYNLKAPLLTQSSFTYTVFLDGFCPEIEYNEGTYLYRIIGNKVFYNDIPELKEYLTL